MVVDHQKEEEYNKYGGVINKWQDILMHLVDFAVEKAIKLFLKR